MSVKRLASRMCVNKPVRWNSNVFLRSSYLKVPESVLESDFIIVFPCRSSKKCYDCKECPNYNKCSLEMMVDRDDVRDFVSDNNKISIWFFCKKRNVLVGGFTDPKLKYMAVLGDVFWDVTDISDDMTMIKIRKRKRKMNSRVISLCSN